MRIGTKMKRIIKDSQPTELTLWRSVNAEIQENLKYDRGGFPKSAVLSAALEEQGYLCAYTLLRISKKTSHVEHLKPQSLCLEEDRKCEAQGRSKKYEDIDWHNMVACFPNSGHPRFGAVQKDDWWDELHFVSPLSEDCEPRFTYKLNGRVEPTNKADMATEMTIKKLQLDCERLKELREEAIKHFGFHFRAENPIKKISDVKQRVKQLHQKNNKKYTAFATVLIMVSEEYIIKLKKQQKRKITNQKLREIQ